MAVRTFHWVDYLVFAIMLLISAGIGVYYFVKDRRKTSTKEFLLGGAKMAAFPVAMSLKASYLSAISILGIPSEIYFYGTMYSYVTLVGFIGNPIVAHVFIPIYRRLELTSGYEYLERRYSRPIRSLGSVTFILLTVLYMAVALYAPAIAFSQVTGLSLWITLVGTGIVCTLYTAMGGMKAVIWTDTFQMLVILVGLIAMLIKGSMEVGGIGAAWAKASRGNRIQFDNFSPLPTVRITFWTQLVGGTVLGMSANAANQTMIQRYLATRTTRGAQAALYISTVGGFLLTCLLILLGIIMYAYYGDCDPIKAGLVEKPDQMVPLLMMDVLGDFYGLPGLFTACTFSAALSTVSSGVNALAAVMLEDIIKPLHEMKTRRKLTDSRNTLISKILAVVFGAITIALGYAAQFMGKIIIQISYSIFGMAGGPLLGLFLQGMLIPWTNKWGAGAGLVASLLITFWLGIGAIISPPPRLLLPTSTHGCSAGANQSELAETATIDTLWTSAEPSTAGEISAEDESQNLLQNFYNISFMWYGCVAVLTSLVVGMIVSSLTGCNKDGDVSGLVVKVCEKCTCNDGADPKSYSLKEPNELALRSKGDDGEGVSFKASYDNPALDIQRF